MTKTEFQREERYVVFKLSDIADYFYPSEISQLFRLSRTQQAQRAVNGKLPLECVVVESDWPEYEPTWKAIEARVMGAQPAPSVPEGWLRAIDEALVTAHIGGANAHDTYEQAKAKLDNLIGFHVDVATDPAVNGGWKLVPIEPTSEMLGAGEDTFVTTYTGTPVSAPIDVYRAMLAAAPETKP